MLRKTLVSIIVLTIYLGSCFLIYNIETDKNNQKIKVSSIENNTNTANYTSNNIKSNDIIGNLTIEKINLSNDIYSIDNIHNNVEENVTILNDDTDLIVLAAHSGPGSIAYFNNLDKLVLTDTINLNYKGKDLIYKIIDIEEQPKDGTIEINKTNTKRLILTTCSKKNKSKQLVITSEIVKDDS